nr:MAG TPA: hypothetical protein [Caudoviricetes sp.]
MVRKENRLYNTVSIILKIQVVTWIFRTQIQY